MGFPDNVLTSDEQVAEHLHPHWITLAPAVIVFLLTCAAGGGLIAVLPVGAAHGPLLIAVLAVAAIVLVWWCVGPLLRWRSTHYVVTTERVIIRTGVFSHAGRDISLARINDVGFERSLWDRMVGAGSLLIESAGEHGQERLVDVPHADDVQQLLNRLIEAEQHRGR